MGTTRPDPLDSVKFRCGYCRHRWSAAPDPQRVTPDPGRPWHPWAYSDDCPRCGRVSDQDGTERALLKAWAHATGPNTPEGIASVTKNLEGHPTPEEARRTRFNALKHGAFAQSATYFPARPGQYPHCSNCQYHGAECRSDTAGGHENPVACLKRTELYMQHYAAVETGDPAMLMGIRANTMATFQAILDDMMLAVIARGVELVSPEWYFDPKEGEFHLVSYEDPNSGQTVYSMKVSAHPLLKVITDWMRSNNITWADMAMTPKVRQDDELLRGYLDKQPDAESEAEFRRRHLEAMENLAGLVRRSQDNAQQDPVLLEYHRESGD